MKNILTIGLFLLSVSAMAQKDQYLLVGTYTGDKSKSEGIYVYRFNAETGEATPVGSAKTSNPSYLAVSPDQRFVYAVNENADSTRFTQTGSVAAFSFDKKTGQLNALNKQESGGKHPCYVSIDKTGKWVIAGNYSSGSLALLPVKKDGSLDTAIKVIEHTGSSVNEDRQQGPHVHSTVISPDNKFVFVPDLGIDKVMIYALDTKKGTLVAAEQPYEITEPGAGPRHFDFHPNGKFAYLIEEMSGGISAYKYSKGTLTLIQNISSLPGDFAGNIGSADIHVSKDGKFLYVSNRGDANTIDIFKINEKTGEIWEAGHQSTLGKTPRNFNFDPSGKFLLVANQNTNDIVIFRRDAFTGLLTDTGKRIAVDKPVCLKWIEAE
jgi:6-phosphogluconolactonase